MLLSGFLNFQNHLEQLRKILDVQLASLSCRQNQKKQSDPPHTHPVYRSWFYALTESFVNPPGILPLLFFKLVLKYKNGSLKCFKQSNYQYANLPSSLTLISERAL